MLLLLFIAFNVAFTKGAFPDISIRVYIRLQVLIQFFLLIVAGAQPVDELLASIILRLELCLLYTSPSPRD